MKLQMAKRGLEWVWMGMRRFLRWALAVVAFATVCIVGVYWLLGPAPIETASQSSRLVVDRDGRLLRAFTAADGRWRLPIYANEVDPSYLAMLFAFEDRRFHEHGGVSYRSMARAVLQFLTSGRAVSGGSTITMQVARILDSEPTRSVKAKFKQIFRAYELEHKLTKTQILELYLKTAPFGGNVEGVRAASLAYFGKEPKRLSLAEAATLVALPQAPEHRRPDRFPEAARRARNHVLDRVAEAGVITREEAQQAKALPLGAQRHEFPVLAAHLSGRAVSDHPEAQTIKLTISRDLQESVEQAVAESAARLGPKLSMAAIVVDHKTGDVLAHVGSPNYFDDDRFGPIDMTEAVRSPGPVLKPFIYGLGFEAGLAHPETLIEDRPARFAGYAPKNFDGGYRGPVTVRQALQQSLNVPAVKMLSAVGPARLAARFHQAGVSEDTPRNLAVALGGAGLRMTDLTVLYGALARGGEPTPLRYYTDQVRGGGAGDNSAKVRPLLSPLAAWYVTNILRDAPTPNHAMDGAVAFNAGTSYGYRDAWSVGFDGGRLVVVWAGRPDSSTTEGLSGPTSAAPLMFDIFARLGPQRAPFAPPPVAEIARSTIELPPPLRYFREPGQAMAENPSASKPPLKFAFPLDKAELEVEQPRHGGRAPVALRVEGGVLPLTWLVNGAPFATSPFLREAAWTPVGKGFVQFSVIDAMGRMDSVNIRLQ